MILKAIKCTVLGALGLAVIGGLAFGTEALSYLRSSGRSVRTVLKDSVPVEFELKRAQDLLDEILPEMHASIRAIATQEVEIDALKQDIGQSEKTLMAEASHVQKIRGELETTRASYVLGGITYSRAEVTGELARRFENYKNAELVLAGKKRLLENRQKTLAAATAALDRARSQKAVLEGQIAALEGQYRLVQAASVGSEFKIDHSKLAQTERLIAQIKKRLDVAERVLAHEGKFTEPMVAGVDAVNEQDLMAEVDEHFQGKAKQEVSRAEK